MRRIARRICARVHFAVSTKAYNVAICFHPTRLDNSTVTATPVPTSDQWLLDYTGIVSKFSLRTADEPEDDLCYIVPGERDTITECEFNPETQTFVIIHGWTVR